MSIDNFPFIFTSELAIVEAGYKKGQFPAAPKQSIADKLSDDAVQEAVGCLMSTNRIYTPYEYRVLLCGVLRRLAVAEQEASWDPLSHEDWDTYMSKAGYADPGSVVIGWGPDSKPYRLRLPEVIVKEP